MKSINKINRQKKIMKMFSGQITPKINPSTLRYSFPPSSTQACREDILGSSYYENKDLCIYNKSSIIMAKFICITFLASMQEILVNGKSILRII
jgi:hypothetical protein